MLIGVWKMMYDVPEDAKCRRFVRRLTSVATGAGNGGGRVEGMYTRESEMEQSHRSEQASHLFKRDFLLYNQVVPGDYRYAVVKIIETRGRTLRGQALWRTTLQSQERFQFIYRRCCEHSEKESASRHDETIDRRVASTSARQSDASPCSCQLCCERKSSNTMKILICDLFTPSPGILISSTCSRVNRSWFIPIASTIMGYEDRRYEI